jgi:hypothetical protein
VSAEPDLTTGARSGPIPVDGPLMRGAGNGPNGATGGSNGAAGAPNGAAGAPNGANGTNGAIGAANGPIADQPIGCTGAQLRRFIKSRAYVPMHELRRRFELNGEADDVSPVATQSGLVYLGLPWRESQLIGELVRQGEVGLELCRDPRVPIVIGVYPMRPITRQ